VGGKKYTFDEVKNNLLKLCENIGYIPKMHD
jgi:hypothetical protein